MTKKVNAARVAAAARRTVPPPNRAAEAPCRGRSVQARLHLQTSGSSEAAGSSSESSVAEAVGESRHTGRSSPDTRPLVVNNNDPRRAMEEFYALPNARAMGLFKNELGRLVILRKLETRDSHRTEIAEVNESTMCGIFLHHCRYVHAFVAADGTQKMRNAKPDGSLLGILLAPEMQPGYSLPPSAVPLLKGISEVPIVRADGAIVATLGYDAASKLYCTYEPPCARGGGAGAVAAAAAAAAAAVTAVAWPPVDEAAVGESVALLNRLLADFPMGDVDRSTWLAVLFGLFMLDADIGRSLPALLIDANVPGSGKTLLAQLLAVIATGRRPNLSTFPTAEEEVNKLLVAALLAGAKFLCFDNVKDGVLGGAALESILTSGLLAARKLGQSKYLELDASRLQIVTTGNKTKTTPDIARRALTITLRSTSARPEERSDFAIKEPLLDFAERNRDAIIAAVCTIIRAHALRPEAPAAPESPFVLSAVEQAGLVRMGSFEKFAKVRALVMRAFTYPDAATGRGRLDAVDAASDGTAEVLEMWDAAQRQRGDPVEARVVPGEVEAHPCTIKDVIDALAMSTWENAPEGALDDARHAFATYLGGGGGGSGGSFCNDKGAKNLAAQKIRRFTDCPTLVGNATWTLVSHVRAGNKVVAKFTVRKKPTTDAPVTAPAAATATVGSAAGAAPIPTGAAAAATAAVVNGTVLGGATARTD
jgi:hypothetical protein